MKKLYKMLIVVAIVCVGVNSMTYFMLSEKICREVGTFVAVNDAEEALEKYAEEAGDRWAGGSYEYKYANNSGILVVTACFYQL